jgi:hypothetical protein
MNKLYIINTLSLPILGNFWHTVKKFASGFAYLDFEIFIINDDLNFDSIQDSKYNFFFIGNHGLSNSQYPKTIEKLKSFPNTTKIFWFFHDFFINNKDINLGKRILTGEHFLKKPLLPNHKKCYDFQKSIDYYHPLTFLSYISIEKIGALKRNEIWDAQFVGAYYKTEWTSQLSNCFIRNTAPEISEEERINSFLCSYSSLGFSANDNIKNNVVTERVAEGISFGNVVLCDNPVATEWTDGIVENISSLEDLKNKIAYYKHNKQAFLQKQKDGYKWAKEKGTYTHLAQQFIIKSTQI